MSLAATQGPSYDETVAGWADHLRSGGTTTWSAWLERPAHRRTQPTPGPTRSTSSSCADSTWRPRAGRPPTWPTACWPRPRPAAVSSTSRCPGPPRRGASAPPRSTRDRLPEDELIRLATGVLVHLLPGLPRPTAAPEPARWPVPWRRRFRLHGSPGTAAAVRRGLLEQGLVESDWRPTHVVIARPVEAMMAEHWAATARGGGILKWSTLWRRAEAAGRLPDEIDVAAIAARLDGRRREPVHVVVARDAQEAAETTARLLGRAHVRRRRQRRPRRRPT